MGCVHSASRACRGEQHIFPLAEAQAKNSTSAPILPRAHAFALKSPTVAGCVVGMDVYASLVPAERRHNNERTSVESRRADGVAHSDDRGGSGTRRRAAPDGYVPLAALQAEQMRVARAQWALREVVDEFRFTEEQVRLPLWAQHLVLALVRQPSHCLACRGCPALSYSTRRGT